MKFRGLLLATSLVVAPAAFADGDSSSDAAAGFVQSLNASEGLIVLVPVNEQGEELVSEAETRLVSGAVSDFATAFEAAAPVNTDAAVSDFDVNADSSTSGWYYGGRSYSDHHYYRTSRTWCPSYYQTYTPTYYHRGYSYSYHRPVYRTHYGHHYSHSRSYYGHRYYYYQRGWH